MSGTQTLLLMVCGNVVLAVTRQIDRNNLGLISAGVAFFLMLSLFPALAALIAILSLIVDPDKVTGQLDELRELVPADVHEILYSQILELVNANPGTLGWAGVFSLCLALWSARAGMGAMMQGLNAAYGLKNRSIWQYYTRSLLLTISLIGVGIVANIAVIVVPVVLSFFPLAGMTGFLVDLLRWIIAIIVILSGIGTLYRYGPNRRTDRAQWRTPGALLAVLVWAVLSIAFSYYVSNFANYQVFYGSIGAVIAMLMWLWISSFLVLLGGALNAELEAQTDSAMPDTASTESEIDR